MHYNWNRYSKFKCRKCGWELARKNPVENPTQCCHCKVVMKDITAYAKRKVDPELVDKDFKHLPEQRKKHWDELLKKAEKQSPKDIGKYGGGKYHNCIHHLGSGKCVHPTIGDRKKGGSGICRYTAETEQKCPGYFGYDKYYSHSKGGRK
jgi:hypothetical protein